MRHLILATALCVAWPAAMAQSQTAVSASGALQLQSDYNDVLQPPAPGIPVVATSTNELLAQILVSLKRIEAAQQVSVRLQAAAVGGGK